MNRDMQKHLEHGFQDITPDIFDSILENDSSVVVTMPVYKRKKRFVPVLVTCFALVLFAVCCLPANQSYTGEVEIEATSSLTLKLNRHNQVVTIKCNNKEGEELLDTIDDQIDYPMDLDDTVNIILTSMKKEDNLTKNKEDLSISYIYNKKRENDIQKILVNTAEKVLGDNGYNYQSYQEGEEKADNTSNVNNAYIVNKVPVKKDTENKTRKKPVTYKKAKKKVKKEKRKPKAKTDENVVTDFEDSMALEDTAKKTQPEHHHRHKDKPVHKNKIISEDVTEETVTDETVTEETVAENTEEHNADHKDKKEHKEKKHKDAKTEEITEITEEVTEEVSEESSEEITEPVILETVAEENSESIMNEIIEE